MKRRFDTSHPMNGRTPPPVRHRYTFRRPALDAPQPPPEQDHPSGSPSADDDDLFASGVVLRLQDEITTAELDRFATSLLKCLMTDQREQAGEDPMHAVTQYLPSYVKLKIEHQNAVEEKKEHFRFTKKLVRASEPLLNHQSVPESEKSGLLEISALAVEKMMQCKMRVTNLTRRIEFLEQEIPQHLHVHGNELGYSNELCEKIARLTRAVLAKY